MQSDRCLGTFIQRYPEGTQRNRDEPQRQLYFGSDQNINGNEPMRIHDLRREHTRTEREAQQELSCWDAIRWDKQKKRNPGRK